MAINFGDILGGLGAAYGGRAQEYAQGIQQREQGLTERKRAELEARQKAMYQDGYQAFKMLSDGNLDGIIDLANDRLEMLSTFQDADPSDTMEILQNAEAAKAGDPMAIRNLSMKLAGAAQTAQRMGLVPQMEQERGVVVNGNVVNPMTGDVIYESPVAESMDEFSPGITRFRNGVAIQYGRQGSMRVVDEQGRVVTGPDAEAAIQRGQTSGITEAGQIAAEQVQGRGASERAQTIINAGIDAASAVPTVIDAISLLQEIKTGGFAGASIRAKSLFGIESGDEGELSNLLSVNVLERLKPIFGAAFTAAEGERLERISASPGRSTDTNIRLLNRELRVMKTALENALDRALDAGDMATVTQIESGIGLLNQFEGSSANANQSTMEAPDNADLINRADAIVRGGAR